MPDDDLRPRLIQERVHDGELPHDALPKFEHGGVEYNFPHCDSLILHAPDECEYCADCDALQDERRRLDVSNTGQLNRRWMCPADVQRPVDIYDLWHGNRRTK